LGSGIISDAFLLDKDGKQYAVKIPRSLDYETFQLDQLTPNATMVDDILTAAVRGKGISHLEQIVAISYDKGVVICELMPGKSVTSLTEEERSQITDEQLKQLAITFAIAKKQGIIPELENPDNLFYDSTEGFGLIDYDSIDNLIFRKYGYTNWGVEFDSECVSHAISSAETNAELAQSMTNRVSAAFGIKNAYFTGNDLVQAK
jgi:hypothetical protein